MEPLSRSAALGTVCLADRLWQTRGRMCNGPVSAIYEGGSVWLS